MKHSGNAYLNLLIMAILSFISMYILMYMMVDKYDNVFFNLNQFYMAGMMTAPMVIIELVLMWQMYANKVFNFFAIGSSICLLGLFIFCIREQIAISDREFLKSMIPHHAGALLMCQKANLNDDEIKKLCRSILSSQQTEIDWMKNKLKYVKAIV